MTSSPAPAPALIGPHSPKDTTLIKMESDMPPGGYAVETSGLTKRFGSRTVVDQVDLLVPAGTAFGYLGPNGAGKTTLIRMLLGLTSPTAGSMRLLGHPVPTERSMALQRVGAMAEEPRFLDHLTGRENLQINAAAREPAARGDRTYGSFGADLRRLGKDATGRNPDDSTDPVRDGPVAHRLPRAANLAW